jgi:hypothetical protein
MSTADEPFDPKHPPLRGLWSKKHPIPDLARIPREHWMEVLRRTHPAAARHAHWDLPDNEQQAATLIATEAWLAGPIEETVAPEAAAYPPPLPSPRLAVSGEQVRQVNFRLEPPVFGELEHAARIVHMRPTALARLLVTRGVTQILQEATENG